MEAANSGETHHKADRIEGIAVLVIEIGGLKSVAHNGTICAVFNAGAR